MLPTKRCSTCRCDKPATVEFFHPNPGGKYGLRGQCRDCRRASIREAIKRPDIAAKRQALAREYVESGRSAERSRRWRAENIDKARASTADWKKRNPEKRRASEQRYRNENREKVREKQRRADAKLQQSPIHVLNKRIKKRIRELLRGAYKPGTIGTYLDFNKQELVSHIERQFTAGMTWDRLLAGEIHIDHILPIASFDIREIGDVEFRACWALANLRPMWAKENLAKQKKVLSLL